MSTLRAFACKFCGREVIANDAEMTVAHQEPECAQFKKLVANHGGSDGTRVTRDGKPIKREGT